MDITESAPTADQMKSIFDYVGGSRVSELVKGASSESDALRKIQSDPDAFQRPVVGGSHRTKRSDIQTLTPCSLWIGTMAKPVCISILVYLRPY